MEKPNDLGTLVLDYADAEFNGRSFNGKSFMATLRGIDAAAAASMATYEGYNAWEVLIHVAYCKYFIAKELDAVLMGDGQVSMAAALEPYPWPKTMEVFAPPPAETTSAAWQRDLDYVEKLHGAAMAIIRAAGPRHLAAEVPSWGIPFGQAIAWLLSHDAYHVAQLRSMGVPGIKADKLA